MLVYVAIHLMHDMSCVCFVQAARLDPENASYQENLVAVEQQLGSQPQVTSNNFHIIRRWSMKELTVLLLKVNTMLFALGRRARCTTTIFIIIWKWWWRRYIIDSFYTEAGYCACILYIVEVSQWLQEGWSVLSLQDCQELVVSTLAI